MKFALQMIEHVDRTGLGAGELHCLGDDRGQHRLKIERRVHRLRHFAKRPQLLDRAAELIGALAQFVQKPNVLDGDGCLVREGLDQSHLLIRERPDLGVINEYDAQQVIAFEDRRPENSAERLDIFRPVRVLRIGQDIGNVDRSVFERGTGDNAAPAGSNRISFKPIH